MKYLTILIFSLACTQVLIGQNCQSAFSFGETGITIDFFDESTSNPGDPVVAWDWDFEEGSSSQQNPTFTFSEPDTYDVCLTITTQNGCTNTSCVEIETCVLSLNVNVGDCDANNEIPITINISDPFDAAGDINISIDGNLVPGSPFRIRDDEPVVINTTVAGDGLSHTVLVNSEDVGTCSSVFEFTVPDCTSDCFLSSFSISSSGGATHTVDVGDDFFSPDNLTITVGDMVDFVWVGDGHSTTSDATSGPDSWNSGVIGFGSNYQVDITNPGVHRYYCIPHGGPNGTGMSGILVANCPPSGQFTLNLSFNTSVANAAGYQVLVDGSVVSQNNYNGTGTQNTSIPMAGDGLQHTIEIQDVNDPSCILSRNYLAPDCGAAPACSLQVGAVESGACNASDQVPLTLTISAINAGGSGFTVLINGSSAGTFNYDPSGTTTVTVNAPGNGQAQNIEVRDNDDNACSGTTTITTTNCTIPCSITGLNAVTGSSTIHTVEVIDFDFSPANITITAGDVVEWLWTGAIDHTATSDATSGADSWDSGLLGTGAIYTSPVLSAGLHPYYCIPHGAPGGVGMAGTITVQADCTNGQVSVGLSFNAQGGSFNGYEILVDGQLVGTGNYDASGQNSTSVLVPGDGQSHTITIRDADDSTCSASTSISTPDCNAPTCSLSLTATESGACNASDEVPVTLQVSDVGGGASGFSVSVDGSSAGTFAYSGTGSTTVTINVTGDGQFHTITITDIEDNSCTASTTLETTNCIIPCSITGLTANSGSSTTHTVEVRDFDFSPQNITITAGDVVEWLWTGAVDHTATSDATSGADSWDSGLLGTGATYTSPVLSAGLHPYYCIPHGAPGGVGMAGTITVQADCTNGQVSVGLSFTAQGGSFNGYEILVDGQLAGTGNYDASGQNSTSVLVPGDGQNHTITIRDADDSTCSASTSISTPDCNAPTCSLNLTATESGACNASDEVPVTLTVSDVGGSAGGFSINIDGSSAGTFAYSGTGSTTVTINVTGDGQFHTITIADLEDNSCTASTTLETTNCIIPCSITGLTANSGSSTTHTVEVRDFDFSPQNITITAGDVVEWLWTGAVDHTATSDATSGADSWDSGLLGTGATYTSPVLSAGLHPYYCIPHGAPGGVGMAGTITVQADCTNGQVSVGLSFTAQGGSFNGYEILVDGQLAGTGNYDASGQNSTSVLVPGDGQNHTITIRDADDSTCSASTSISTPDCNAPTCSLNLTATESGACNASDEVPVTLTVSDVGGGASGFSVSVDGSSAGTFAYSGTGSTTVTINVTGDGQFHTITITDIEDNSCTASTTLETTNCILPCSITGLTANSGSSTTHTVEVRDFDFSPQNITITAGDVVEWLWTGAVDHTATSDATSGADSWDSGLLGTGATYTSPVLSAGLHPYYCIPHGAPGGIGMAGTITVQADCTNGQVSVGLSFNAQGGSFNGYEILVDGQLAGTGNYDASGQNSTSVLVPGDGQSHTITIRDADDSTCSASTSISTPDCNAPTCSLNLTATESGACNASDEVPVTLQVSDVGGSASGFSVNVDGNAAGTFAYSGTGSTTVTINVTGDGQFHTITITDIEDNSCTASTTLETTNCIIPCSITGLTASSGSSTTHTVEVRDFDFSPQNITITAGDVVEWLWTGAIDHTATSDATSGADSWDSGLLGTGATYTSPVLSAGLHPYYCIPHGAPGGVGMAGTITVQADCTNGQVSVGLNFNAQGGSFNGYEILVDGQLAGTGNYDASGQNSTSVLVPGDGQNHTITIRDADDSTCSASTSISTPDCNAPTCSLNLTATESGACNASDEVPVTLTVADVGGGASGFSVNIDGNSAGTYNYSGTGSTTVTINVTGDGQFHTITINDLEDNSCTASTTLETTNCIIPCSITGLTANSGSSTTHTVEVRDFDFSPQNITITAGDVVEWLWTGAVDHTATSDATSGADSWDSGLLGTGATYTSPVLSAGLHPYYCIPHGAPGGVGMAGTITVQADCTNGQVSVGLNFNAQGGSFNGYEILVDGQLAGTGNYDASGQNSTSVLVPGDGQSHTITIRDADDSTCSASTSISTPDCNAPTCSLSFTAAESGACNASDEVPVTLQVSDVGGNASGFSVNVDGNAAGTFAYSGTGTTTVTINIPGDGQFHTIIITDIEDNSCTASTTLETTNCATPCELNNLQLTVAGQAGGIVHEVEVRDFVFAPATLNLNLGDTVRFIWTGVIPHTTTSDASAGPDGWDSGLLGQGTIFDVVPTTTGTHSYYCIPHGAPGGIGMAGTLEVSPPCDNGMATVAISFNAMGNSSSYRLWVDGQQYSGSPFEYTGTQTTQLIQIPGDGQSHLVRITDLEDESCFVQNIVAVPDCGGNMEPCELTLNTALLGDCNDEGQVEVGLTITAANQGSGFLILLDGTPISNDPVPYAVGGTTNTSIWLNGTGSLRTLTVMDQDSTSCVASSDILLPDCEVNCLVTDLVVATGPVVHTVLVEDFVFNPSQVDVNVGDTIRYVWTGVIPHTTTSDATSGEDVWNSDLFGQGATYDVVIQTEGEHPYYCIPHGGPGGIGMAGNITATKTCNNGQGLVNISFNVTNGSPLGYRVFVDGSLVAGPIPYENSTGENVTLIELTGDATAHILTVQDMEVDFCAASTNFTAPDCPAICLVENFEVLTGSDIVHTVAVEDFVFEPSYLQARVGETIRFVWTGEIPHTTTSDATTGADVWDSGLLGQGGVYEFVLTEAGIHPYYCIPHGGPGGIGMAGIIEALPACEDTLANYQLRFSVSNGSDQGYRVFVGGVLLPDSPFSYDDPTGQNVLNILYPSFGEQLVFTVQDVETPFCAATRSILSPDCSPQCNLEVFTQGTWECGDAMALIELAVVAQNPGSNGFQVLVDGIEQEGSPYAYTGDTTLLPLLVINDGLAHEITIQDLETSDCQSNLTITADCEGSCGFIVTDLVIGTKNRHEVQVRDFDFLPLQLAVEVGDTIHFIWTGDVPHTVTSDANEGPDVWNSGLVGNGAEFEVIIQSPGEHPYYCIPHGAPGGIGMAANITAAEECEDDELNVQLNFALSYPAGDGYQLLINEALVGSGAYQAGNLQQHNLTLPGDGQAYLLSLLDNTDPSCRLDTLIQMPDCDDVCFGVVADYTFQLTPTPFTYQFTDISTGEPDSWFWDFGDGNTSNVANPLHSFPGSGDYQVCLIIRNESLMCQDTICQTISIGDDLCEANFSYEIAGLNVMFTDESLTSSAVTNWTWTFPQGVQIIDNPTPSYTFPELATYEVCLTIVTDECTSTYCDSLDLSDPCLVFEANFATQNGDGLEMLFIDQTTGTPNQWLWGFGDGTTSTQQFPSHEYATDGIYRVCLLVQDTVNNCNSVYCVDQLVGTVATHEQNGGKALLIFPNPAAVDNQQWRIEGWKNEDIGQELNIHIYQMNGQRVRTLSTQVNETVTLQLSKPLPPGIYLVEAKSAKQVYLGKIVIQ